MPFPEDDTELNDRPEVENLINIYSSISGEKKQKIFKEFSGRDFKGFKEALSETVVSRMSKISNEMNKLLSDKDYLNSILLDGFNKAKEISETNMREIKKIIKFYSK